ncbi:putative acetyl xylan esterase [Bisporella sp. PMI_857]|nr:putative acetyl xylan esterase [Bisporella sp. PMI_857]
MLSTAAALLLAGQAFASPANIDARQSCPEIHIFGARETTAPAGYGTASVVVNLILNAYPGSTAEAIVYPACGGQASCGGTSYANSVVAGTKAAAAAVNSFNTRCPTTKLVLVGYSQGGQIFDNAFCGGGDTNSGITDTSVPIQASAINMIAAAIFQGDPRYIAGLPYNVGTCQASGFAPRPAGFQCPSASKIQSYCDSPDPYCCNGSDANAHQQYGAKYGQAALTFVKSKLAASPGTPVTTTTAPGTTPTAPSGGGTLPKYAQCGGQGWTGSGTCVAGTTCTYSNQWYSQCL